MDRPTGWNARLPPSSQTHPPLPVGPRPTFGGASYPQPSRGQGWPSPWPQHPPAQHPSVVSVGLVLQQNDRNQSRNNGVAPHVPPPSFDSSRSEAEVYKAVKFLVASQLSKFFQQPKYFDGNNDEFLKCCKHLIDRVFLVEKGNGSQTFQARKTQEGVVQFVNAYMDKYAKRKRRKLNERDGQRAGRDERAKKRSRRTYGDVNLVASPYVSPGAHDDEDEAYASAGSPSERGRLSQGQGGPRLSTQGTEAPSVGTPFAESPSKQMSTQTPQQGAAVFITSQPITSHDGVRVDYGYDEDESVVDLQSNASSSKGVQQLPQGGDECRTMKQEGENEDGVNVAQDVEVPKDEESNQKNA